MAAKVLNRYSGICFMTWILCGLPSMLCATTHPNGPQIQTSNNVTTSPFQGPSFQNTAYGAFSAGSGNHMVTEPRTCDTTLEKGPKNKSKNEGDGVTLTCDLKNVKNRSVLWAHVNETGFRRFISINDNIYFPERYDKDKYRIVISEDSQTYRLKIKDLEFFNDSGTYNCGYNCDSTGKYIPLASAVITVLPKFNPSPSCRMNLLPSLGLKADVDTFEIMCFWTHGYKGNAHFVNDNGEDMQVLLTFPDRIISRIKASNISNITCHFRFSTSSSETRKAPCTGNERTGILRVDPFINEVTVNSNATFKCSFLNHGDSHKGSWKIHYGANASLVTKENLIESQKIISIVNVSESHQSILVECALNVSENDKISSFGTIRIARMTTSPPDENPIQWTTNKISKTTTDRSESRPTTITMLPEATRIRVPSPQASVPTSTVSKSVRPTTSTRMFSEASSISVTSPLTSVATTPIDISESTRPTTATHMLSEAPTITVTTPKKSVATTPNIVTPRRSGIPSCKIYTLPVVESDYRNRDYEIMCSWSDSQAYQAQLQRSNGETIDNYLTFANRIISRVKFSGSNNINCRLSHNRSTSAAEINTPCIEKNIPSFIRVDPFVTDVDEGSSAAFTCTFNDHGRKSSLSWKVHSSGNPSVDDPERIELYPNVNFAVYKQKDGEHLLVECHFQLYGNRNMSSYGLLRIIEGTTSNPTTSVEGQTNQITDNQSFRTVESTTKQNNITETRPPVKMTTMELLTSSREVQTSQSVQTVKSATNKNSITETRPPVKMTTTKFPPSSEGGQTSQITDNTSVQTREFTTDHDNTSETHAPPTSETHTPPSSKKGLVVMISVSVLVAVVILLLSLAIVYLLKKQKRMSLPRRLSEDDKTNKIELSNIPHILHEESSEWYALSFKDKRVQDMQGQQSNDLIVQHQDESDQNIPMLSSSLGIPSLHLLDSIDENVYAEPDVSEEPIRQTISRQQCTFTPLLEDDH